MRRIGRYILNGLTVLSLVLCVATVGLWLRSYGHMNDVYLAGHGHYFSASSAIGILELSWDRRYELRNGLYRNPTGETFAEVSNGRPENADEEWHVEYKSSSWVQSTTGGVGESWTERRFLFWEFSWEAFDGVNGGDLGATDWTTGYRLRLPHWTVVLLLGVLPLAAGLRSWRRKRRRAAGLCSRCAFDLRATPDRCPECGTIIAEAKR